MLLLKQRLVTDVEYTPYQGRDSITRLPVYGEKRIIKAFKQGQYKKIRNSEGTAVKAEFLYITEEPIEPQSLLDGYPVISCSPHYENHFNPRIGHYEVWVGEK